jgi:hypothetical protein
MPKGTVLRNVIKTMRRDTTGTYAFIMKVFAPAVVTNKKMTNGVMCDKAWSSIVSVSDEAFILLALLNAWNTWVTDDLKIPFSDEEWPQDKQVWSTDGQGSAAAKYKGWAKTGLEYYATLFKAVRQDRCDNEQNNAFNIKMSGLMKETLSKKNKAKLERQNGERTGTTNAPVESFYSSMLDTIQDMH